MATEAQRLIGISLTKIAQSRANRGGVSLHKNLLVATVLQKARYVFMEEAYNMVHYQSPAPVSIAPRMQQSEDLVGLTAEEAGIDPISLSEDVEEASTSETSLPDFLQPCVKCSETQDKENQPPPYHSSSELTYLDLDKSSNVLRERSNSVGLKRRRAIAEWETEEAVQSILPKRSRSEDDSDGEDSVFLGDATVLSESVSKDIQNERVQDTIDSNSSGSSMEIDRITSLVSIFSFGMSESGKLSRSMSTPDLCSAQAKDTDDALQQRPFLAMTV
ncbi:uncharacterized protein LOC108736594 [Agrilus planipennis]|uniref:Uncharacterized protein LOC108736594 n=1 Tax=Agrilus planipennis TaxID=224129 RepID=A0A1W4WVM9_AGRPL|nr:uncharacterized protein LOC108736594 [Agrilus planipennis]